MAETCDRNACLVNGAGTCFSSGGLRSFLLLPDFRNNSGNILSYAILELLLVVTIETKISEGVWWWEVPAGDHSKPPYPHIHQLMEGLNTGDFLI